MKHDRLVPLRIFWRETSPNQRVAVFDIAPGTAIHSDAIDGNVRDQVETFRSLARVRGRAQQTVFMAEAFDDPSCRDP